MAVIVVQVGGDPPPHISQWCWHCIAARTQAAVVPFRPPLPAAVAVRTPLAAAIWSLQLNVKGHEMAAHHLTCCKIGCHYLLDMTQHIGGRTCRQRACCQGKYGSWDCCHTRHIDRKVKQRIHGVEAAIEGLLQPR
jgi:hypothetical protein